MNIAKLKPVIEVQDLLRSVRGTQCRECHVWPPSSIRSPVPLNHALARILKSRLTPPDILREVYYRYARSGTVETRTTFLALLTWFGNDGIRPFSIRFSLVELYEA